MNTRFLACVAVMCSTEPVMGTSLSLSESEKKKNLAARPVRVPSLVFKSLTSSIFRSIRRYDFFHLAALIFSPHLITRILTIYISRQRKSPLSL